MMECPNCHAKLQWGYPTPEMMEKLERGELKDVVFCGCVIHKVGRCPTCHTCLW